ncbi:hypothetical protein chiPu_0024316, partial [Chiloscyllium punctatum]|nr:hypothetical protein [Chiloscyllium punctatum]
GRRLLLWSLRKRRGLLLHGRPALRVAWTHRALALALGCRARLLRGGRRLPGLLLGVRARSPLLGPSLTLRASLLARGAGVLLGGRGPGLAVRLSRGRPGAFGLLLGRSARGGLPRLLGPGARLPLVLGRSLTPGPRLLWRPLLGHGAGLTLLGWAHGGSGAHRCPLLAGGTAGLRGQALDLLALGRRPGV